MISFHFLKTDSTKVQIKSPGWRGRMGGKYECLQSTRTFYNSVVESIIHYKHESCNFHCYIKFYCNSLPGNVARGNVHQNKRFFPAKSFEKHLAVWREQLWQSRSWTRGSRSAPLTWLTQSVYSSCVCATTQPSNRKWQQKKAKI